MLRELGTDAYAEELAAHRRIVREACVGSGGVEVDITGDAFFFAFQRAADAVARRAGGAGRPRRRTHARAHRPAHGRAAADGRRVLRRHGRAPRRAHRGGRATAARCSSRRSTRELVPEVRVPRPRRAAAQGPDAARADLPARLRGVPAGQEPEPHEPADRRAPARRTGGRAGASCWSCCASAGSSRSSAPAARARRASRCRSRPSCSARSWTACSSSTWPRSPTRTRSCRPCCSVRLAGARAAASARGLVRARQLRAPDARRRPPSRSCSARRPG